MAPVGAMLQHSGGGRAQGPCQLLEYAPEKRRTHGAYLLPSVVNLDCLQGRPASEEIVSLEYIEITGAPGIRRVLDFPGMDNNEAVFLQKGGSYLSTPGEGGLCQLCERERIGYKVLGIWRTTASTLLLIVQRPRQAAELYAKGQLCLSFAPEGSQRAGKPQVVWSASGCDGVRDWAIVKVLGRSLCVCVILAALLLLRFKRGTAGLRVACAAHKRTMSTCLAVSAHEAYLVRKQDDGRRRWADVQKLPAKENQNSQVWRSTFFPPFTFIFRPPTGDNGGGVGTGAAVNDEVVVPPAVADEIPGGAMSDCLRHACSSHASVTTCATPAHHTPL